MNTKQRAELLREPIVEVWDFATDNPTSNGGIKFSAMLGNGGIGWMPQKGILPPLEPIAGLGAFDMGGGGTIDIPIDAGVEKVIVEAQQFQDGGIFKNAVTVMANAKTIGVHSTRICESNGIGFWNDNLIFFRKDDFIEGEIGNIHIEAPANGAILTRLTVTTFLAQP
jgi:hypothetical protein